MKKDCIASVTVQAQKKLDRFDQLRDSEKKGIDGGSKT
jgi:hypothetical protein